MNLLPDAPNATEYITDLDPLTDSSKLGLNPYNMSSCFAFVRDVDILHGTGLCVLWPVCVTDMLAISLIISRAFLLILTPPAGTAPSSS